MAGRCAFCYRPIEEGALLVLTCGHHMDIVCGVHYAQLAGKHGTACCLMCPKEFTLGGSDVKQYIAVARPPEPRDLLFLHERLVHARGIIDRTSAVTEYLRSLVPSPWIAREIAVQQCRESLWGFMSVLCIVATVMTVVLAILDEAKFRWLWIVLAFFCAIMAKVHDNQAIAATAEWMRLQEEQKKGDVV